MYRSSPFRSTLNTGYITALDMYEVCTEAVHSAAVGAWKSKNAKNASQPHTHLLRQREEKEHKKKQTDAKTKHD